MIRYNPKDWFGLLFHAYSRYVIRTLTPLLISVGLFTAVVAFVIVDYFGFEYQSTIRIHSLLGIVLGLFLVFRTNSAYDRWYEGRRHWGYLVNNTRSLAIKLNSILGPAYEKDRKFFARMIPNFAFATKEHLRNGVLFDELEFLDKNLKAEMEKADHKPNILIARIYDRINKLYQEGAISGEQLFVLDHEIIAFSDIIGSCERIKATPIPYSYSMFMKKFIVTFTITLPFGLVTQWHYWTIPIVLLIFYILVSIELIAEEIEDPFGKDINDLPTDDLSHKIRQNVQEILK